MFSLILLIFSICALSFAYAVEYIMHLHACPLCIYQRFPYLVFIVISIIRLNHPKWKYFDHFFLCFAASAIGIALYHSGVERGFFEMSAICKQLVPTFDNLSIQDLKKMIYNAPITNCNKPALVIVGLSMSEWNLIANTGLVVLMILLKWTKHTKNQ